MPKTPAGRDLTLDIAKGIAIILVILGHIFQDMRANFDEFAPFRVVYSFHMPLFIFLSGSVVALRPAACTGADSAGACLAATGRAVTRSTARLAVPFIVWAVIAWFMGQKEKESLGDWLVMVARHTDNALWFLLAVFDCVVLWQVWHLLLRLADMKVGQTRWARLGAVLRKAYITLPASILFFDALLRNVTSLYGIGFIKVYYPIFIVGALYRLYHRAIYDFVRARARAVFVEACAFAPYIAFAALAPFWHRMHPSLPAMALGPYIAPELADKLLRAVTAISGILVVMDMAARLQAWRFEWAKKALAYCGLASLGIYAVHFYLLGYRPLFVAPLALSLIFYAVVSRIPVARALLLGEKG